jgi:hypothetical protein
MSIENGHTAPVERFPIRWPVIAGSVLAAVLIRFLLLPAEGLRGDLDQFARWIGHLANAGLSRAYDADLSFGPVVTLTWGLLAAVEPAFRVATDASDAALRTLIKLPPVLADFGLAALVGYALRDRPRWATVAVAIVLLHPVTWYVSAWWGQYESLYVLAGVAAAVFAINGRDGPAALLLAIAVLTKPQALPFLVPFAAWFFARGGWLAIGRAAVIATVAALFLWLPFLASGGPLNYLASVAGYQDGLFSVLSLRAWNVWWLVQEFAAQGEFASDRAALIGPVTLRAVGLLLTALAWVVVAIAVWRDPRPRTLVLGLAASTLASFTFMTTMHERYAYAAAIFLILLVNEQRARLLVTVLGTVLSLNLVAAAPATREIGQLVPIAGWLGIAGSALMTALTLSVLAELWRRPARNEASRPSGVPVEPRASPAG